jgi:hypothetical protein
MIPYSEGVCTDDLFLRKFGFLLSAMFFTLTVRLPCIQIQAGGRCQSQLLELFSSLIPPVLYRLLSWLGCCRTRCWMMSGPILPPAAVRGMTVWQPQPFTLTARLPCIQIQAGGCCQSRPSELSSNHLTNTLDCTD